MGCVKHSQGATNDCDQWHVVETLRLPAMLHDLRQVHPTQQDFGHIIRFLSGQKNLATPLHSTTLKCMLHRKCKAGHHGCMLRLLLQTGL